MLYLSLYVREKSLKVTVTSVTLLLDRRTKEQKTSIMLEVKDYTKQELADALYSSKIKPESRLQRLRREVSGCQPLMEDLHRLHYHTGDSSYTAEMVERIKYWLCYD